MESEDKKAAEETVTFLNRGKRHFDLDKGADGSVRRHAPGATMVYSAAEAARLGGYSDLVDITKLPGQVDAAKVKAANTKLAAENAALKAQLEALESPKTLESEAKPEPEPEPAPALSGTGRKRR